MSYELTVGAGRETLLRVTQGVWTAAYLHIKQGCADCTPTRETVDLRIRHIYRAQPELDPERWLSTLPIWVIHEYLDAACEAWDTLEANGLEVVD